MERLVVHIEGIGWWSPGATDWNQAAAWLRDGAAQPATVDTKPAAGVLPPQERRRAPEPVLLACEVAAQACAMAARDPATLPSVFSSVHGDLAITDALCTTLAAEPLQLSPTRFHNSVHNAPAGYWTIAVQCRAASSAVSAWHGSFAAGLFEAAMQAIADDTPILFVAYDIATRGPLAEVAYGAAPFAAALALNPQASVRTLATLRLGHVAAPARADSDAGPQAPFALATPLANALPLFAMLARSQNGIVHLPNAASTSLDIEVRT
ncbi:MAG: beta-ketoacyl synthase chain length factor [Lysobacterales bacterium]|jgi:hypothetical protein